MAAGNRGDWQAWTDVYARNAVVMPPNSRPLLGREALEKLLTELPPTSKKLSATLIAFRRSTRVQISSSCVSSSLLGPTTT